MRTTLSLLAVFALTVSADAAGAAERDLRVVEAARRQDAAAVRTLLKGRSSPDLVNAAQGDGATGLHWAAYWNDLPTATLLLAAGARPNVVNDLGVSPLSLACTNSSDQMVLALLSAGADANLAMPTAESPLMTCARSGNVAAVKALIGHGAKIDAVEQGRGQTALMWAAAARHPRVVQALIEARADVNARSTVTSQLVYTGFRYITAPPANPLGVVVDGKEGGFTALLFAAQQGDLESARLLLDAGARVEDADAAERSALILASHSGHGALAALLLDRGADANAAAAGYTALHAAVLRGDMTLAKRLLAKGANPNARLTKGTPVRKYSEDYALSSAWLGATPYWLAAKFAEGPMMRLLADGGADTRLAAGDGSTPLMATLMGSQGTGDRRDRFLTEVEIAAREPGEDVKETNAALALSLSLGADVNAVSAAGDTALHLAVGRGLNDAIGQLVSAGADFSIKNKRGQTALAVAIAAASRRLPDFLGGTAAQPQDKPNPTVELLRKLGAKE